MAERRVPTLPSLRGPVNEQEALAAESDIIHALSYPQSRFDFYVYLQSNRQQIEHIVSRHLGVPQAACSLGEVKEWIHGSFNVCLPLTIHHRRAPRRVIIRFPLPYKLGESHFPGNVEEKLRCEAAAYIWLQTKCPSVPIARLFAFGLPGTQCFTHLETSSYWSAAVWRFRRIAAWFSHQDLSPYVIWQRQSLREVGYLIIEYVEDGLMLSESWEEHRHEQLRRTNLFRGLSRVQLELLKHPLPCIGSLTINNSGILELANRPLTLLLHELENHGIPTHIARDRLYSSIEHYYLDLLDCHDSRMRHQPNSILDIGDGQRQLASLVGMRALLNKFTARRHCGDPCFLSLTDLHQSNIFVDDEWNITRIIDLEWACARPTQMQNVPYWLTSQGLDQLTDEALQEYRVVFDDFVRASKEVEDSSLVSGERLDVIFESNLNSGRFWFTQALDYPDALYSVFVDHIQSRFGGLLDFKEDFDATVAKYWDENASGFITTQVNEYAEYRTRIQKLFADINQ